MSGINEVLKKVGNKFIEQQKRLALDNCDGMIRIGEQLGQISDFFRIRHDSSIKTKIDGDANRGQIISDCMEGKISRKEKERRLCLPENQRDFSLVDIAEIMDKSVGIKS